MNSQFEHKRSKKERKEGKGGVYTPLTVIVQVIVSVSAEARLTAANVVSAQSVGLFAIVPNEPLVAYSPARSTLLTAVKAVKVLTNVIIPETEPIGADPISVACAEVLTSPPEVKSPPGSDASVSVPYAPTPRAIMPSCPDPPLPVMRLFCQFSPGD